jgi:large conductance mechanosensitive channel
MRKILKEFQEFVIRGNVVDLAVGLILGVAFGKIVASLVSDIIMPPIGKAIGGVDFVNLFITLGPEHYATLADAKKAGAATINYGVFLNTILEFIIVAFFIFLLVRQINVIRNRNRTADAPSTKECPHCFSTIPLQATRCPNCTSQLQPT